MSFYQSRRAEEVAAGGAVLRAVGLTPNQGADGGSPEASDYRLR